MLNGIEFAHVYFLWLLALLPLSVAYYIWKQQSQVAPLKYSATADIPSKVPFKVWLKHIAFGLQIIAFGLIIVALARPQSATSYQNVSTEGIDIVISLDISGSMLAKDFNPNRLDASKKVAQEFIDNRINDRIGLVVYAGESFTQCPLTTDHAVLKNLFKGIENGMIEDGTAVGEGLATAVNRLKDSEAKSKVVILLTDGSNNAGDIPPVTAAEIAKTLGIRVYTIGVGTNGMAPMPVRTITGQLVYQDVQVFIDEETLEEIATLTGGQYFRATDNKSLENIYKEIDKLEKSKIEVTEFRKKKEEYLPWLLGALALLVLQYLIRNTIAKSIT
tara:strand:- start:632 stop:1627 length:996 start_codon:yes stop_codon:yes gene_type:complete